MAKRRNVDRTERGGTPAPEAPRPAPPAAWHPPRRMGLARALHQAGWGTRKVVEGIVTSGRIRVDGLDCRDPRRAVDEHSVILMDGRPLAQVRLHYYAFHKPARVVCAAIDGSHFRLVADFLPRDVPGLRAAGRLDNRTTGLLLVSNDPAWNTAVTGNAHLEQEYRLHLEGELTDLEVGVLTAGVHLPNLGVFRPLSVTLIERGAGRTALSLVVREGKVRQVRRMFSTLRHRITLLRRVRIGSIELGALAAGGLRPLTAAEVASLRRRPEASGDAAEDD